MPRGAHPPQASHGDDAERARGDAGAEARARRAEALLNAPEPRAQRESQADELRNGLYGQRRTALSRAIPRATSPEKHTQRHGAEDGEPAPLRERERGGDPDGEGRSSAGHVGTPRARAKRDASTTRAPGIAATRSESRATSHATASRDPSAAAA